MVKGGTPAENIVFVWGSGAAEASEYHVNAAAEKGLIPDAKRPSAGSGAEVCTVPAPALGCTDEDALITGENRLFYQAFQACGPDGNAEGLF